MLQNHYKGTDFSPNNQKKTQKKSQTWWFLLIRIAFFKFAYLIYVFRRFSIMWMFSNLYSELSLLSSWMGIVTKNIKWKSFISNDTSDTHYIIYAWITSLIRQKIGLLIKFWLVYWVFWAYQHLSRLFFVTLPSNNSNLSWQS